MRPMHRSGFTAVELMVVLAIIMALLSMSVPAVLPMLRKGAVNQAVNDLSFAWNQARTLAMTVRPPSGGVIPHYGVAITQEAGRPIRISLIYGTVSTAVAADVDGLVLTQQRTVGDFHPTANPALVSKDLNSNVMLKTMDSTGTWSDADQTILVYAQYRTGVPISGADVSSGRGPMASPMALGNSSNPAVSAFRFETLDYQQGVRGTSLGVTIYEVGLIYAEEEP